MISLFFTLREISGEGLFAGLFIGAAQVLWLAFGIAVIVANDF